jgi:hypothetical protein
MRFVSAAVGFIAVGILAPIATASAAETAPQRTEVGPAIDRGLAFLVKDAQEWKKQHNCVSCHHASLVIWSMHEARLRGHSIDGPYLAVLTKWVAESGDGKTGLPRPAAASTALNAKAVHFALGLAADPAPDKISQDGMKRLLKTVESDQTKNGSWTAWPETRPPIFGNSDQSMTVLATLAVLPAAAAGDNAAKIVRDKGVEWLSKTSVDDELQSTALRLVLWRRLGRSAGEWQPLVERLKQRQNADGGFSQTSEMASDAWATGQALYALANAGLGPTDYAVARGQAFLVKTQRSDGSWPMTSRPVKPGGAGSTSLIPITGAGTAWAVIGLARSS